MEYLKTLPFDARHESRKNFREGRSIPTPPPTVPLRREKRASKIFLIRPNNDGKKQEPKEVGERSLVVVLHGVNNALVANTYLLKFSP